MDEDRQPYIQELEKRRDNLLDKIVRTVCTERNLGNPERLSTEKRQILERDVENLAADWAFAADGAQGYPEVSGFLRRLLKEYDQILAEIAEQKSSGEGPFVA